MAKKKVEVKIGLEKKIAGYTVAALGLLGASNAKADIIYTPGNGMKATDMTTGIVYTPGNGSIQSFGGWAFTCLDSISGGCNHWRQVGSIQVRSLARSAQSPMRYSGSPNVRLLGKGAPIGPAQDFGPSARFGKFFSDPYSLTAYGPCVFGCAGFVGFRFTAADGTHYGWANFDVWKPPCEFSGVTSGCSYHGIVYGVAYDTVPGQEITTGEGGPTPEPGTLGLLALGSLGLGFWRKRKTGSVENTAA